MQCSELLSKIIKNAEQIKLEYGLKHNSATTIIAACSEFQFTQYSGLNDYYYPERFEEERLRYIYKKILKLGGNLRSNLIKKVLQNPELDLPFDFTQSEKIAEIREKTILSADLVFLSAFTTIPIQHRICPNEYKKDLNIIEVMTNIDTSIYNYVIEENQKICEKLQKRINEAVYLRDWKPAKKFTEPQALSDSFFSNIKTELKDNILEIQIPFFFGISNLLLSVHCVDETYYLHDNGCAIKHLKSHLDNAQKLERILSKVCSKQWIKNGIITGFFTDVRYFFIFLQYLIFIANADLFYTRLEKQIYSKDTANQYLDSSYAKPFDPTPLLKKLKDSFRFGYDKNIGLFFNIATTYSLFSTHVSFQLETLYDDSIRISDSRKGKTEGEIFEAFYWLHNDISPYQQFVEKFANRFSVKFEDGNIYSYTNTEKLFQNLFNFINTAILLSEIGHNINLPKDTKSKEQS